MKKSWSLRQAAVKLAEKAAKVMEKDGFHTPLLICEGKQPFISQPDFSTPVTKSLWLKAIARQARQVETKRVFLISEAWGVASPESLEVRASQHPRRQEILTVAGQDEKGHLVMVNMPIIRRKGKVMVGPMAILDTTEPKGFHGEAFILRDFFAEPRGEEK